MGINSSSKFSIAPVINIERSTFPMGQKVMTTLNAGDLVPLWQMEILPGDTISLTYNTVCRMMTPIYPVMDVCVFEYFAFYTPNRQLWDHWKEFMGENTTGAWVPTTTYTVPRIKFDTGYTVKKDTVMGHLGVPLGKQRFYISALPIRNYIHIWNEFFRDQNLIAPLAVNNNVDADTLYTYNDPTTGGKLLKVAKKHDYFTSALPAPQKGPEIKIPVESKVPVLTSSTRLVTGAQNGMTIAKASNGDNSFNAGVIGTSQAGEVRAGSSSMGTTQGEIYPTNLYTNMTDAIGTINALRLNIAIQNLEVKGALYGTRYFEQLKGQWGVDHVGNLVMMRPEFLGSRQIPINVQQVNQTVGDTNAPLGNTGAYSLTNDLGNRLFTKSFTEHGWIMIVGCVRQLCHSYQQGLNRCWSRRTLYDFYNPVFRHLSEQPIYNKEIYMQGDIGGTADDEVFGYQERWAEYRYLPNLITGEFCSSYSTPLDQWHYGDYYSSLPVLSQSFVEETKDYINRTIAVQNHDQFMLDGYIQIKATRPMPMYSIGSFMDHL